MSITNVSAEDKAVIPIGESQKSARTNMEKFHTLLGFESINESMKVLAHDLPRASITPSLVLFAKTLSESNH